MHTLGPLHLPLVAISTYNIYIHYIYIYIYLFIYTYTYIYIYIHVSISISLSLSIYIYIYVCMYIYIYKCVCVCIYIYIHNPLNPLEPLQRDSLGTLEPPWNITRHIILYPIQSNSTQSNPITLYTTLCYIVLYPMSCVVVHGIVLLCYVILWYATPYHAMSCYAMSCYFMWWYALLCYVVQHFWCFIALHHSPIARHLSARSSKACSSSGWTGKVGGITGCLQGCAIHPEHRQSPCTPREGAFFMLSWCPTEPVPPTEPFLGYDSPMHPNRAHAHPWDPPVSTPNLPTNIIPTKIRSLIISGQFPMNMRIPPLNIKTMRESNPLKSRILVRRLAVKCPRRRDYTKLYYIIICYITSHCSILCYHIYYMVIMITIAIAITIIIIIIIVI